MNNSYWNFIANLLVIFLVDLMKQPERFSVARIYNTRHRMKAAELWGKVFAHFPYIEPFSSDNGIRSIKNRAGYSTGEENEMYR